MTLEVIQHIPLEKFICEPQVRERLDPEKIERMAQSFRSTGQLQPTRSRRAGDLFAIVDGHYRTAAAKRAGFKTLATIIEEKELSEGEVIQRQLIANCQREDLTALETARAVEQLIKLTGWTAGQTAAQLGFSDAKVSGLRKLLTLPEAILVQVESGKIPASAACELARVEDPARQAELAQQMSAGRLTRDGVAGARKAAKRSTGGDEGQPSRVTAVLGPKRSITVAGAGTLEQFIELIELLLGKARRERSRGTELATFIRLLRDQAKAT